MFQSIVLKVLHSVILKSVTNRKHRWPGQPKPFVSATFAHDMESGTHKIVRAFHDKSPKSSAARH